MLPVNTKFLNKFNLVVFDRIYTSTTAAKKDRQQTVFEVRFQHTKNYLPWYH